MKKVGILKNISVNYNDDNGTWWTKGGIIINGYEIKIEPKWKIPTMDEAVKDIKKRITEAALEFDRNIDIL